MTNTTTGPWLELAVEVAGLDAELAADLLRQACPGGVAIEAASRLDREIDAYVLDGEAPALVKGYLPSNGDNERVQQSLRLALQTAPLQRPPTWRDARELLDEDWRDSWKKYFGIQRIGARLIIAPSWIEYEAREGEIVLRIDPGMAFGTGQHQTTAMCLRALEQHVHGGETVLDLGCGSGILALAAARLGAGRVIAIDNDEQAVKATRENAEINGATVELREGTLPAPGGHNLSPAPASGGQALSLTGGGDGDTVDLLVANISAITLERLSPALAAAVKPGGLLITSGFLEEAVADLRSAFEMAGFAIEDELQDGQWRTLIARRN
jgi:ribosomal protein L11 methyltransferase